MKSALPTQPPPGLPRNGLCWYCARPWLRQDDPPDHFMLMGLGARLATRKACQPCNARLGEFLDTRCLRDWFIALERTRRGLRDRRRGSGRSRPAAPPRHQAALPDGTPIAMDLRPTSNLVEAQMRSDAEGPVVLGGTLAERRKLAADARERAAARGKQLGPVRQQAVGRSINVSLELDLGIWPRYAARVALGTCSLLGWSDRWLAGPQGTQLRDWLWDDEPKCLDGESLLRAPLRAPPSWVSFVCDSDHHLLAFWPGSDGRAGLHIVLFGRHSLCLVVDPEGEATPRRAWRMAIDGEPVRLNFNDLADEAYAKVCGSAQSDSR